MQCTISIAILAPYELVREGLRRVLANGAFNVVAAAGGWNALEADLARSPADILVVDGDAAFNASELTEIRKRFPEMRIAMFVDGADMEYAMQALESGVDGVLEKEVSCEQVAAALNMVALGQRVVPSRLVESLANLHFGYASSDWEANRATAKLSDREIEILKCLAVGEANKVISRRLNITEATVKVHIKAILRKLHVMNRTQAAIWAVVRGLNGSALPRPEPSRSTPAHMEPIRIAANGADIAATEAI
ncbi:MULTISPECIES: LuxR C-terminal-related transcriptional regulator [Sphingomonas]|uniref:DNA-binding response regulator n=1 Tax=Edaphosphingomonas fennica TaxID=114404 RepID=A0A2T4HW40_9SPHN|nr:MULTISPECIES: response regulator transcription factor [Sphingomonas]AGH48606.1 LuxR family two component transcriptional regulator [Sphingomonas sp. MM-1]PTD20029.1 DNA-binding response regulator [Sphingomonas fennica]